MTMKFGFGQPLTRKEDDVLLRGAGRYVADVAPEATLHAVMLRSPHAHARFSFHDLNSVRAMPGVRLVLIAPDIVELGPLPTPGVLADVDIKVPVYPILAKDVVRHVGDAIAFVVADSLAAAKDAAEAIAVDWQPLPHVIGAMAALEPGAPLVWPDRPGNLAFETAAGDVKATKAAFAQAAKTVSLTIVNQRLVTNYMDTRGVIAEYDGKRITLTLGSQGSHIIRDIMCNDVLRISPDRMRVITPDVGGGFGTKLFPYREYALAAVAAERLRKPVKWIADRSEHFLGDSHGRDNISSARLALDDKGRFLGLELDIVADMGAYLSCYGPYIPWLGVGMATGAYDIPAAHVRLRAAYTNTVPVDAYRGAGRPEASYLIERLVDAAARDLDIAPDALRRKNLIKPKAMPYTTPTGKVYDSGDFAGVMARAQEVADWKGFNKRAAASKRDGKLRGIGMATYIEACGNNGPETANVQLDRDGGVTVLIGSQSTGQGHATSYAQLVAERLDLPPERVRVMQGDTDAIASGAGTGGSSSIPVGGVSVDRAAKTLAEQLKQLAADALEAARHRYGNRRWHDSGRRHRPRDFVCRSGCASAGEARNLTRVEPVRHRAADISERHAHRGSRGRSIDRRDRDPELRRGGRFRRHAQSIAARRPSARRRGAGHRAGADGGHGLRSGVRTIAQRQLHGLCDAARRRRAGLRIRDAQCAVQEQSARRQRRGRGRRSRFMPRGHERRRRRALAQLSHPPHRHAGDVATGLGGYRTG